jgi:hypothetical protein
LLGKSIGQGNTVRDPTDELLTAVGDAYRAAAQAAPGWNHRDFYVSFGADDRRSWTDARKYGFVSAGGGTWYSRSLQQLKPGHRVFAYIPKGNGVGGYVGVAEVTGNARPINSSPSNQLVAKFRFSICRLMQSASTRMRTILISASGSSR